MGELHIVRLRVVNFRGVSCLDTPVGEHGALFVGGNAQGKTSVLRAIRSALSARDIGPDAIRHGENRAEILVDMAALTVKRTITPDGSKVVVTQNGKNVAGPQAMLTELLGTTPLDPLDLFLEKDKGKRRAKVLTALPIKLTREAIAGWVSEPAWTVPLAVLHEAENAHGLEGCAILREHFYALRKEANVEKARLAAEIQRANEEAEKLPPRIGDAPTVEHASNLLRACVEIVSNLASDRIVYDRALARVEGSLKTVASLRAEALAIHGKGDAATFALVTPSVAKLDALAAQAADLRKQADALDEQWRDEKRHQTILQDKVDEAARLLAEAREKTARADELEASVRQAIPTPPSDEAIEKAERAKAIAEKHVQDARNAAAWAQVKETLNGLHTSANLADSKAGALTTLVDRFTHEAPSSLLAQADAIPGLGVDGDDITLNGVKMDTLSGAEQMRFAIEVARRANAKSKLLIVDQLERLDGDSFDAFVREATRDGWQLIGSRVTKGDVEMVAISQDEPLAVAKRVTDADVRKMATLVSFDDPGPPGSHPLKQENDNGEI